MQHFDPKTINNHSINSNNTFDIDYIDRKNEDRLNRLKDLGLGTIQEDAGV